jgi:hypothetical protein
VFLPLGKESQSADYVELVSHKDNGWGESDEIMIYAIEIELQPTPPKPPAGCE